MDAESNTEIGQYEMAIMKMYRTERRPSSRCSFLNPVMLVTLATTFIVVCFTLHMSGAFDKISSSDTCRVELTSAMTELEGVMNFKYNYDRQLAETQKTHKVDKDRFKSVMDACFSISQQAVSCQAQYDSLVIKCKKNRAECAKKADEVRQLKLVTNMTNEI